MLIKQKEEEEDEEEQRGRENDGGGERIEGRGGRESGRCRNCR